MRLSDQPEYLAAVPAIADGDYDTGRRNLERLLVTCRERADVATTGFVLQLLGDLEARSGNFDKGRAFYEEAVRLDSASPLPLLLYAKSLATLFADRDLALLRLAEAEQIFNAATWRPIEDGLDREWYQRECNAVRKLE